jgi:hypothetical protein
MRDFREAVLLVQNCGGYWITEDNMLVNRLRQLISQFRQSSTSVVRLVAMSACIVLSLK